MVDYSKWDKFDYDEDDDEPQLSSMGEVRKIGGEKGGQVQIGPSGYSIHDETGNEIENFNSASATLPLSSQSNRVNSLEVNTENGSIGFYRGVHYYWSQSRYEVTLSLFPEWIKGLKKKDISISYFSGTKELKIVSKRNGDNQFVGNFQFGVEVTGDPENPWDEIFEWKVVPDLAHPVDSSRLHTGIQIVLKKISPLPNSTFWWKNVFVGEPHIDVTKISGRSNNIRAANDEFQQAQNIFLERMRAQREQGLDTRTAVEEPDDTDGDK
jgi:hypothetical protein